MEAKELLEKIKWLWGKIKTATSEEWEKFKPYWQKFSGELAKYQLKVSWADFPEFVEYWKKLQREHPEKAEYYKKNVVKIWREWLEEHPEKKEEMEKSMEAWAGIALTFLGGGKPIDPEIAKRFGKEVAEELAKLGVVTVKTAKRWARKAAGAAIRRSAGSEIAKEGLEKTFKGVLGKIGKGFLFTSPVITAGILLWNIITDPFWISSFLHFIPTEAREDIEKRFINISKLISSARSLVYQAERERRPLTEREKELIAETVREVEREIQDFEREYKEKFVLWGKKDLVKYGEALLTNLRLQLQYFEELAGIRKLEELPGTEFRAIVAAVIDGDTIRVKVPLAIPEWKEVLPEEEAKKEEVKYQLKEKWAETVEKEEVDLGDLKGTIERLFEKFKGLIPKL